MDKTNITIGIDEVGRGPWAGPLTVCAVALDMDQTYEGLADSKKLSVKKREALNIYIKQQALSIGIGWVNASELDELGMTASLKLAARRAYSQLDDDIRKQANHIVIDGNIKMLDDPRVQVIVKADAKVTAVSAASIIAKVARDHYMYQLDKLFPEYGFKSHVGYGTKQHMAALVKYGVISGVHRASFAPIRKLLGEAELSVKPDKVSATAGRIAEGVAADYLADKGYEILDRNWKTKFCEIDIIARKNQTIYFAEVKYREEDTYGDGVAAITPKKLEQMRFAAQLYLSDLDAKTRTKYNAQLMAVSLSGNLPVVDNVIEII